MPVSDAMVVVGAKATYTLVDNDDASPKMKRVGGRWSIKTGSAERSRKYNRLDIALERFARHVRYSEKY